MISVIVGGRQYSDNGSSYGFHLLLLIIIIIINTITITTIWIKRDPRPSFLIFDIFTLQQNIEIINSIDGSILLGTWIE